MFSKNKTKQNKEEAWIDGSALRGLPVLTGDLSLVPSTHICWLTTASNSSSKETNILFWVQRYSHTPGAHIHT